jgi:PAS domain S-box-containing protein
MGWPIGHVYVHQPGKEVPLQPSKLWHLAKPRKFAKFRKVTEVTGFRAGEGLPGRVLATLKPAWINDVTKDANFPRAKLAGNIGVRAGLAFPIMLGDETLAVLEFFSDVAEDPDQRTLEILANVGRQFGSVIARKRLERELRDSKERLITFVDQIPASITLKDQEERYLLVNKRFRELRGMAPNENPEHVVGKTTFDIHPAELAEFMSDQDKKVLADGSKVELEFKATGASGEEREYLGIRFPVFGSAGDVVGVGGVNLDITDRKIAEAELARKEAHLRAAMENMTDGMYLLDEDLRFILYNDRYKELVDLPDGTVGVGNSAEKAISAHARRGDYGPGKLKELVKQRIETLSNSEQIQIEMRIKNGERVVDLRKSPIEGGGAVVTLTDITERKRAEEEMLRQTNLLNDILDSVGQGILAFDADHRVSAFNKNYTAFWPRSAEELKIGATLQDVVRGLAKFGFYGNVEAERIAEERVRLLASGAATSGDIQGANGIIYHALSRPSSDGGFVITYTDITERNRIEEAMRESEQRLVAILQESPIAVIIIGVDDNRLKFTNARFHEIFAISETEALQSVGLDFYADAGDRKMLLGRLATEGAVRDAEVRLLRGDGSEFWTLLTLLPFEYQGAPAVLAWAYDISERKQAERELKDSEELLKTFVDHIPATITLRDVEGRYLMVNKSYCELLNVTPDELVGKVRHDVLPSNLSAILKAEHEAVVASRTSVEREGVATDANGVERNHFGIRFPVFGSNRDVVGIGSVSLDITERKQAETELQGKSQQLRHVLESVGQGVVEFDSDRNLIIWNKRYQDILSLPDTLLKPGRPLRDISLYFARQGRYGKGDPDTLADQRIELLFSGQESRSELSVDDNHVYDVLLRTTDDGGIVITYTDITERKQTEAIIAEKEAQLRMAMDNMPGAMFVVDRDLKIVFVNDTYKEYYGVPDSLTAPGSSMRDIIRSTIGRGILSGEGTEDGILRERIDSFHPESTMTFEDRTPDGRYIHTTRTPAPDGHTVSVAVDITERRQAEVESIKARDAAEAATKAKAEFLANMSHEIRTPMNAVIGLTRLALQTELNEKQRDYLTKSKSAADNLLAIINNILDFSSIESGKLTLEAVDFNLNDVLDNVASILGLPYGQKALEFVFSVSPGTPTDLVGDPMRLGQILINIANNAMKFTNKGEVVLSVKPLRKKRKSVLLQFSVSDTGIGLTEAQVSNLFAAFSQADASMTRKYGGTGLGLTISKRLAEKMAGDISVESTPRQGSTFTVTARFGLQAKARKATRKPFTRIRGAKILVVDDNETSRAVLRSLLESMSFEVETATSMKRTLSELKQVSATNPYRFVLVDHKLSRTDGLRIVEKVRSQAGTGGTKIVLLSDIYKIAESTEAIDEAGVDSVLMKPFTQTTLVNALKSAIRDPVEVQPSVGKPEIATELKGCRILLAEDDEVNQQVAQEILENAGLTVDVVANGKDAVDRVKASRRRRDGYDAVLMDIQMPIMGGLEATRRLRRDTKNAHLPIVAMTAHTMAEEVERCLDAGMNDHVAKPIEPERLFAVLEKRIVTKTPSQSSSRSANIKPPPQDHKDGEDLPANVPGIDIQEGLKRVGGNQRIYRKLLATFLATKSDAVREVEMVLNAGDTDTAERLAHGIKGVAGNISAKGVHKLAQDLEAVIKSGDRPKIEKAMKRLAPELNTVIGSLQAIFEGVES